MCGALVNKSLVYGRLRGGMMKRWRVALGALSLGIVLSLFADLSLAESPTFNAIFFKPAIGRNPYAQLMGTDVLHHLQFNAGAVASYGYKPLQIRDARSVVEYQAVGDFVAALGISEKFQIGLDFPMVIMNRFSDPLTSPPFQVFKGEMGDLRIEFKAKLLNPCQKRFGFAIAPFVTIPTGKDEHYVGDPGVTGGARVAGEFRVSEKFGITANLGYQGGKKARLRNIELQHRLLYGAGAHAMLKDGFNLFAEINGEGALNKLMSDRDMNPAEALVGAQVDVGKSGVSVEAAGGTCLVCGVKGAKARAVIAAKYRFNPEKFQQLDRDDERECQALFKGVSVQEFYDLKVKCPDNPTEFKEGVDDESCPKFYEMRELADLVVRCPKNPDDFDPKIHDPSCPKAFSLADTHAAEDVMNIYTLSVVEMGTRCPEDPSEFNPAVHDVSCQKFYEVKKAVAMSKQCPTRPEDYREGVSDPSCPKFFELRDQFGQDQWSMIAAMAKRDSDSDGINDYVDKCPNEKGDGDNNGCPKISKASVAGGEVRTLKPVYFSFNSFSVSRDAEEAIDQVIDKINRTQWINHIRVGGHSDGVGTSEGNESMSRKRAEAVISYMKSKGIRDGVELVPIAYGANRPVANNTTNQGRAFNRRVIFNVVTSRYNWYLPKPKAPTPSIEVSKPVPIEVAPAPVEVPPAVDVEAGSDSGEATPTQKRGNKFHH